MYSICLALAACSPQTTPPCTAQVQTHGDQPPIIEVFVGYGLNGYDKTGLIVPEPIPVAVEFNDQDRMLVLCGPNCDMNDLFDSGPMTLNWRLTWGGPPADLGGFLTPLGVLDTEFQGDSLLYVPPKNVVPGTSIQVILRGAIWDRCPEDNELDGPNGHSDNSVIDCSPWELAVPVNISCSLDKTFNISIPPFLPPQCGIEPPSCVTAYNPCCHLIQNYTAVIGMRDPTDPAFDPSLVPTIEIEAVPLPEEGMLVGEIRPICVNFRDLDLLAAECGHGGDPTCPPANPKDFKKFCDGVQPEWSIEVGPTTGDGIFLWAKGRVALFRATKAGPLEIKVKLADGELLPPPSVSIEFPVRQLTVRELSFGKHHRVLMDAGNGDGMGSMARAPYTTPHWLDNDLDGEATQQEDGDRRFPVCYTSGKKLAIARVDFAEAETPSPEYSVLARAKCKFDDAPSEATLFTLALSSRSEAGGVGRFYSAEYSEGSELESSVSFPDSIQRYSPLTIVWEVSFSDGQFCEAGETDNYVYVVRADPPENPPGRKQLIESVLYISCGAADRAHSQGQEAPTQVFNKIYAKFQQRSLKCKPYHGSGASDGRTLGYHLNGAANASNVAWNKNDLLASLDEPINQGNRVSGTCRAFSELLLSCVGVQGISAEYLEVTPRYGDPPQNEVIMIMKDVETPNGGTSGSLEYPFAYPEDLILAPRPAQGNTNPIQLFTDHALVRYANVIYDPSYGAPVASSVGVWETGNLWGVIPVSTPAVCRKENVHDPANPSATRDCTFLPIPYP